jgi:hypothetical protein
VGQEGPDSLEQPVQGALDLGGIVAVVLQIPIDVLHGRFDDVQRITQPLELVARDDQLGLAETELVGPSPSLVVTLPAGPAAELGGTSRAGRNDEPAAAPPAPSVPDWFRHCAGT